MWSIGCLLWSLYTIGQKQDGTVTNIIDIEDSNPLTHNYKVKTIFPLVLDHISDPMNQYVNQLLKLNGRERISVEQLMTCPIFNSGPITILKAIEALPIQDRPLQIKVLNELFNHFHLFPTKIILHSILPVLYEVLKLK